MTAILLRPYLPDDAETLAELFRASVIELAADDYDEDQRMAWAEKGEDVEGFAADLAQWLTLVATLEGETVGFASLKDNTSLQLLYVHPDASRMGVATTLVDALERLAGARGAVAISVDASETAQPFFAQRGYAPLSRNTVMAGEEWLANTSMKKDLAGKKELAANTNQKGPAQ